MYAPVMNAREVARNLIDIAREETDASMTSCSITVNMIINRLMKSLPHVAELADIRKALQYDNLVDVENCYDAHCLNILMRELSENIEDKEQQSWTLQDDEEGLIELLDRFTSLLRKAERRVLMKKLGDFKFIEKLVVLYQVEQRAPVQNAVVKTLVAACALNRKITVYLVNSNLPVLLVVTNAFKPPLGKLENSSLKLLAILFSTSEKPPLAQSAYFTPEFLAKMLNLISLEDPNALQFLINFNYQFDEEGNPVLDLLRTSESVTFGHMLINLFNKNRNDEEELASLKMIWDIYTASSELVNKTFYTNDLKVLADILAQVLLDTNNPSKIKMILEIFEKMVAWKYVPCDNVYNALRIFVRTDDLDTAFLLKAQALAPPELLLKDDEPIYDTVPED